MSKKQLRIQIFRDGKIQTDVIGVKGKSCTDYIEILEQLLEAEILDSNYTAEYYETEQSTIQHQNITVLKNT